MYDSAVERVIESCGERVFEHRERTVFGCCQDVILNPNAIVTLWDATMMIDLAGNKEFISFDEFSNMEII